MSSRASLTERQQLLTHIRRLTSASEPSFRYRNVEYRIGATDLLLMHPVRQLGLPTPGLFSSGAWAIERWEIDRQEVNGLIQRRLGIRVVRILPATLRSRLAVLSVQHKIRRDEQEALLPPLSRDQALPSYMQQINKASPLDSEVAREVLERLTELDPSQAIPGGSS